MACRLPRVWRPTSSRAACQFLGVYVQRTTLQIMCILTSNTPSWITTYIECSAMPTPRRPMQNSHRARFTEDSMCFDIFLVLWATSLSPTFSIECRSACLITSRSGFSTLWRRTNGSTSTMHCYYPHLHTMTSYHKISHMRKFLNGMGRRWKKWAGTCLEL